MIVHRAYRDIQRCKIKYGESWTEYEKLVPYLFIPVSPTVSFRSHANDVHSMFFKTAKIVEISGCHVGVVSNMLVF